MTTGGRSRPWRRDPIVLLCAAVAVVAAVVGIFWSLSGSSDSSGSTAGEGTSEPAVELSEVDDLREHVGDRVVANGVEVDAVPADEGFWVDAGGDRVWVQVDTAGESPFAVQEGQRLDLTGTVVAHGTDFVQQPDFPAADAEELADAGAHVEVDVADVRVAG
jgi:hypothetical protein